ncbi:MAG: hypothetical protein AB9834_10405 [Lentimicrobium sp.]
MRNTVYGALSLIVLCLGFFVQGLMAAPYEVVMVRGKVVYRGAELKKGNRIEAADLDIAGNMKLEMLNFTFGASSDEVRLLDLNRRKLILLSAKINKPGKDLMLATRGMRFLRSDFEFQRAFTPKSGVITMIAEDTIICPGLERFRFNGDIRLAARYTFHGKETTHIIGCHDSLFITRKQLFETDTPEGPCMLNSYEVEGMRLLLINHVTLEETALPDSFMPFSLFFMDDIIKYMAGISYNDLKIEEEDIFRFLIPTFIAAKQIQRETGQVSEEEAFEWLRTRIKFICSQP